VIGGAADTDRLSQVRQERTSHPVERVRTAQVIAAHCSFMLQVMDQEVPKLHMVSKRLVESRRDHELQGEKPVPKASRAHRVVTSIHSPKIQIRG